MSDGSRRGVAALCGLIATGTAAGFLTGPPTPMSLLFSIAVHVCIACIGFVAGLNCICEDDHREKRRLTIAAISISGVAISATICGIAFRLP